MSFTYVYKPVMSNVQLFSIKQAVLTEKALSLREATPKKCGTMRL